jgi:hypothetical protein
MKKILLSLFVLFTISINAQNYSGYNTNQIQVEPEYQRILVQPKPTRVKNNILPTIIGAIVGAAIVNSVSNNQYNNCNNPRFAIRQNYYQNQLEIQRLQLLQLQIESLESQNYTRSRGFLGIFPKRHRRHY